MNSRTIKGKSTIEHGEYVLKNTSKDLRSLFDYLERRSFDNYPKILEISDRSIKTEYIKEDEFKNIDKTNKLMEIVGLLHYKTSHYIDVSKNKYKEIYEKINDNLEYLMNYYNKIMNKIEGHIYFSPSEYFLARNFNIILSSLVYSKEELDKWYDIVENKTKQRVVIVHNNLKTEHLLRNEKDYLINWDKYLVDTPVLDLYKFYINEGMNYDFKELFEIYNNEFKLLEEEKKLLFILMSIPKKIEFLDNEFLSTYNIKKIIDTLYKTRSIVSDLEFKIESTETDD